MVRHLSVLKVYCYVLIIMTCISTTLHGDEAKISRNKSKLVNLLISKHSDRRLQKYLRNYKIQADQSYLRDKGYYFGDYMATNGQPNSEAKEKEPEVYRVSVTKVDDEHKAAEEKQIKDDKAIKEDKPVKEDQPTDTDKAIKEDKPIKVDKPINKDSPLKQDVVKNQASKQKAGAVKVSKRSSSAAKTKKLKSKSSGKKRWWWSGREKEDSSETAAAHGNPSCESEHPTLRMETLLVVDRPLVDLFEGAEAARDYVLAAFTTARNLFLEPSLGQPISLVIVRMIVFDHNDVEINLSMNRDLRGTLTAFSRFQHKVNPTLETHPNHHDMSVLVTRAPLCESEETCGIRAAAHKGGACNTYKQAAIVVDTGIADLGHSIAHAIAIALGIEHDGKHEGSCHNGEKATVMQEGGSRGMRWSQNSRDSLKKFLSNRSGECLEDAPADHSIKEDELLPGVTYGGDDQCKALLGTRKTKTCSMGLTCTSLNCMVHGLGCVETNVPPAFGTPCGEKSWCWRRNCLPEGERPGAVDGGWGQWGTWGPCSRPCGSGVAVAERECNNPPPSTGGKICLGPSRKHYICNNNLCPEDHPLFRDTQCAGFNDWEFPEDKMKHKWKAFFDHEESPCSLVCKNEKGDVALLKPHVTDGTPCFRGTRDVCVGGECQPIPCDLNMNSDAMEDACGVCHGDGTQCKVKAGIVNIEEKEGQGSLVLVVNVPRGTRNIKVMEMEPSESSIVIHGSQTMGDTNSSQQYVDGEKLGLFSVPGSEAWVGTVKPLQELLLIPGPVTQDLQIMVRPKQHVSFYYSIAKEAGKRKGVYSWDFLEWSLCSATCGPGTERAVPHCMEHETGLVERRHCSHLLKPDDKTRECEITPCTPRWVIGDWQPCEATSDVDVCERSRSVWCMRPMGQADDSMSLLDADECGDVGPRTAEECSCKGVGKQEGKEASASDTETVIVDRTKPEGVSLTLLMGKTPNFKRRKLSGYDALRFLEVQCEGDASLCEAE